MEKMEIYQHIVDLKNRGIIEISAYDLAKQLNLTRNEAGSVLNELFQAGLLIKTNTKPEKYTCCQENQIDCFQFLVGTGSSLDLIIEQCKIAVEYPMGLPILICGQSGTGKSMLAKKIHEYAQESGCISKQAPMITLNCADYADNPHLLTGVLFGYKKGAFTGASENHVGMIEEAEGGLLFLDEVHRLSFESQEKLFMLMDQGKYRPLGESAAWKTAKVRFVLATTEDINEVLLRTFRRRIPVKVTIPSLAQRPLQERMELIYRFYQNEANLLEQTIEVSGHVISLLSSCDFEGNVGELENIVKLSVARAYFKSKKGPTVIITEEAIRDLPISPQKDNTDKQKLIVIPHQCQKEWTSQYAASKELWSLIHSLEQIKSDKRSIEKIANACFELEKEAQPYCEENNRIHQLFYLQFKAVCLQLFEQYGIQATPQMEALFYYLKERMNHFDTNNQRNQVVLDWIKKKYPSSFYIANQLCDQLIERQLMDTKEGSKLTLLYVCMIIQRLNVNDSIKGIIVAHGDSTAHSIAKVANVLCQSFVFEAFDMNLHSSLNEIVDEVLGYLEHFRHCSGIVLMFDMGSLGDLYSKIKDKADSDLLVINSLTTSMALEVGMQIKKRDILFKDIVEKVKPNLLVESQYYEGCNTINNMIITSLSGMNISSKVKEILEMVLPSDIIQIHTSDFDVVQKSLENQDDFMFKGTRLILTTSDTLKGHHIPVINIAKIINGEESVLFYNEISDLINDEQYYWLRSELLKFFSIEGAGERLRFLNPAVVIDEIEEALKIYEKEMGIRLEGYTRANLYLHISAMIERLMLKENMPIDVDIKDDEEMKAFTELSNLALKNIILKYKVSLTQNEIYLIYLLIK